MNRKENIEPIKHLIKPMPKRLNIDMFIKKQNYKGANKKIIDSLIVDMAIEEPIEDLLKMIGVAYFTTRLTNNRSKYPLSKTSPR